MPCPGYPQTQDVDFLHETLKTVRKASIGTIFPVATAAKKQMSQFVLDPAAKRVSLFPIRESLRSSAAVISRS